MLSLMTMLFVGATHPIGHASEDIAVGEADLSSELALMTTPHRNDRLHWWAVESLLEMIQELLGGIRP